MNRELAARRAFFNAVSDQILVPGGSGNKVSVSDFKANTGDSLYVLIEAQTASGNSNFTRRSWNASLSLAIVHKQDDSYTRDIVDDVSEQIENILTPGIASLNGLEAQAGWNITNLTLVDVSYADFQISETETMCMKILNFNFIITKI